jgi:hypothetical protein
MHRPPGPANGWVVYVPAARGPSGIRAGEGLGDGDFDGDKTAVGLGVGVGAGLAKAGVALVVGVGARLAEVGVAVATPCPDAQPVARTTTTTRAAIGDADQPNKRFTSVLRVCVTGPRPHSWA